MARKKILPKNNPPLPRKQWLNTTVVGASVTSFISDLSHEMVTSLLPAFLLALGAPAYALGLIEGVSDGLSSIAKLLAGFYSDKVGKRKEIATLGYVATGLFPAAVALASSWPLVLLSRGLAWAGKGIRGPPRNAIMAKSVDKRDLGKAFGFHRGADTLGAVLAPIVAYLLTPLLSIREIFWVAFVPGVLAVIAFSFMVREDGRKILLKGKGIPLFSALGRLPLRFKEFLGAVFVFGISDFSHTLLIFFAVATLAPSMGLAAAAGAGVLLYALRNATYALACFPVGYLGDKLGRRKVLAAGYGLAVLVFAGFALTGPNLASYAVLFALAGIFIAAEDSLEDSVAAEMVAEKRRGTAFGALATVNGAGDLASSVMVGVLWSAFGFSVGFAYSAILALAGTVALVRMIWK